MEEPLFQLPGALRDTAQTTAPFLFGVGLRDAAAPPLFGGCPTAS
jgi:hypothetical protein